MKKTALVSLLCLAACASSSSHRQDAGTRRLLLAASERPADRMAAEVCLGFDRPERVTDRLASSFTAQVPGGQVAAILERLRDQLGACTGVRATSGDAHAARYQLTFSEGFTAPLAVSVDPSPPHEVVGLWIGNPVQGHESLEAVVAELRELPGRVSFLVADLGGDGPTALAALAPEERLAVGSAFKLWVLAELVRAIEAGERRWDEVVPLAPEAISLPTGRLQSWPAGAPLTLHTLGTLMISESDNTATDQLVHLLGRERIEETMAATGHGAPERNRPFLTTRELFLLKGAIGERYLAADEAGRRRILAEELPALDPAEEAPTLLEPTRIDSIEWFASATDMARALDWLRAHDGPELRGVLSVNPGFDSARDGWRWVGFKGGSEPGVLNLSFLLEAADGRMQVVVATWNDGDDRLDEARFLGLVERTLFLLAEASAPPAAEADMPAPAVDGAPEAG